MRYIERDKALRTIEDKLKMLYQIKNGEHMYLTDEQLDYAIKILTMVLHSFEHLKTMDTCVQEKVKA